MKYLTLLPALLIAATQAGCVSAVPDAYLQWQPPSLSRHGCQNLTGMYQDRGTLSQAFYAGLGGDKTFGEESTSRRKIIRTPYTDGSPASEMTAAERAFNKRAVLSIRHEAAGLEANLMDDIGEVYERITVRLDTPMTGCQQGALILRWKSVGRRAEWGGGDIVWGEREIRKLEDGSLLVTNRQRQRSLSIVTGGQSGDTKVWPETTNRYFPIR